MEFRSEGAAHLTWWVVDPKVRPNWKHRDVDVLGRMEATSFHVRVATTAAGVHVDSAVPRMQCEELGALVVGAGCPSLLERIQLCSLGPEAVKLPLDMLRWAVGHEHKETGSSDISRA